MIAEQVAEVEPCNRAMPTAHQGPGGAAGSRAVGRHHHSSQSLGVISAIFDTTPEGLNRVLDACIEGGEGIDPPDQRSARFWQISPPCYRVYQRWNAQGFSRVNMH